MNRASLTFLAAAALPALLLAHGGEHHGGGDRHEAKPPGRHGGQVLTSGEHSFEVIFGDGGIHVFSMDSSGAPLTPRKLSGKVVLRARRGKPKTLPLEAVRNKQGEVVHLMAKGDFSGVRDGSRRATFQLDGLGTQTASFWTVLRRTEGSKMAGSHSDRAGSDHSMAGSHNAAKPGGQEKLQEMRHDAVVAAQAKRYPIDWCVVSGDKLGGDGEIIDHVHQGRLVRLCCKGCIKEFQKDPQKYLGILDAAAAGKPVQKPAGSHSSGGDHGGSGHHEGHGGHDDHGGHGGHSH